jgi:phage shock protein A
MSEPTVVEKWVGPNITQKMIDAWNDNLNATDKLKKDLIEQGKHLEKHNNRISALENKMAEFALKADFEKLKQQVTIDSEKLQNLTEKVTELRKFVDNELLSILRQIDACAKKDELNLLRSRVDNLEKMIKDLKKSLDLLEVKLKGLNTGDNNIIQLPGKDNSEDINQLN